MSNGNVEIDSNLKVFLDLVITLAHISAPQQGHVRWLAQKTAVIQGQPDLLLAFLNKNRFDLNSALR